MARSISRNSPDGTLLALNHIMDLRDPCFRLQQRLHQYLKQWKTRKSLTFSIRIKSWPNTEFASTWIVLQMDRESLSSLMPLDRKHKNFRKMPSSTSNNSWRNLIQRNNSFLVDMSASKLMSKELLRGRSNKLLKNFKLCLTPKRLPTKKSLENSTLLKISFIYKFISQWEKEIGYQKMWSLSPWLLHLWILIKVPNSSSQWVSVLKRL